MIVTGITELTKSRCKIELDHQFAFVLYKGELRQYHLREGEAIREEDYQEIIDEVLPKRAKKRCMNLLQSRDYTESQLRAKLDQALYPPKIIDQAIDYVSSYRYINDLRYAEDYITTHETTRSHGRINQDLYRRGLSKETIEQAWHIWETKGGTQDEYAMIQILLQKKHYIPETATYKEKQKLYAYLTRKGYSPDSIHKALQ